VDIAKLIDHTLLKPDATADDIRRLCREAVEHGLFAVCVNSYWVPLAVELTRNSMVKVCSVIGFPLGASPTDIKADEARWAIKAGAHEVDMVMNIGVHKSGQCDIVKRDIAAVVEACRRVRPDAVIKVILECCYLTDEEKTTAAKLAEEAGADFVKTSTGFGSGGATVEDVRLLRAAISPRVKVKAAGGIRSRAEALAMIKAGADRLGTSHSIAIIEGG
jgi:deoxyribose-phosphate aldolase